MMMIYTCLQLCTELQHYNVFSIYDGHSIGDGYFGDLKIDAKMKNDENGDFDCYYFYDHLGSWGHFYFQSWAGKNKMMWIWNYQ